MKILMVCLGNICRSPLAEGILKHKAGNRPIFVDSAGTSAYHAGELPDSRSIQVANKYNIDITDQRSRPFVLEDFKIFDFIFVMDSSNYSNIMKLTQDESYRKKVKMILNMVEPDKNKGVPDPYFDAKNGFEIVYNMLEKACDAIVYKYDKSDL